MTVHVHKLVSPWYYSSADRNFVHWHPPDTMGSFGFPDFRRVIEADDNHKAFFDYCRENYRLHRVDDWVPALLEFGFFLRYINEQEKSKLLSVSDPARL